MAQMIETHYKDLLNPMKDIEKSFTVNISELLLNFIEEFADQTHLNFNSAALLLQGSASIYGKKVEYLHNLATQLHNNLMKQKKNDKPEAKKEITKEKTKKEDKLSDPFISTDFKIGKTLSCLRKNISKVTSKQCPKKFKASSIPVHLLSNDNDDKGEVFYDTRGEVVGNKGDFAINKCRLISSGWLLLPTVNPNLIPSAEVVPDYYDDSDISDPCELNLDDIDAGDLDVNNLFSDNVEPSPDEGIGSSQPSTDTPSSTSMNEVNSENNTIETPADSSIAPPSTDEGVASTPNDIEIHNSPGNENIPVEKNERSTSVNAPKPIRHTVRQALQTCQLSAEDDPLASLNINKELLKRRKIEKKNVCCLPARLKMLPGEEEKVPPISKYCTETFFDINDDALKKSRLNFDAEGLDQNTEFLDIISERLKVLKTVTGNKIIDPIEDEEEIILEDIESLLVGNENDDVLNAPFDDNEIQIDHNVEVLPVECPPSVPPQFSADGDNADIPEVPDAGLESPEITQSLITHEEFDRHIRDLQDFVQNSDITKRVHEWEENVKPFLEELDKRESFDINLYGSRILNSFQDNSRKQTMTFRRFCKNKEKWEIHRYFMALLPLANIGNVSIEAEPRTDGTEEIFVTLLSRKMHHKELEEFGHNTGSHS